MGGNTTATSGLTDDGRRVAVDGSGNVYVAGEFTGSGADFGSTILNSAGGMDGFVTKLNASGTFQWAKSWGTSADDYAPGVGVDSSGNVYALGEVLGSAYSIHKYSSTGAAVWTESIAANPQLVSADFAVNGSGNVFVGGNFEGTVDFDPSSKTHYVSSGPAYSGFVLDLDTNGKFGWVSPFVGQGSGFSTGGYSGVMAVALDSSGNIDVGGTYGNSVDFDPGRGVTTLPTMGGGFIVQLNRSGGLNWARALESGDSSSSVSVYGLAADGAGNVYATGKFSGSVDLDPNASNQTQTSAGGADVFVVKLDAAGNFGWGTSFGGPGADIGFKIAVDTTGAVYIAGSYQQTVDFNPDPNGTPEDLTSAGGNDMFVLQLNQS
jgi:hypothetical protein